MSIQFLTSRQKMAIAFFQPRALFSSLTPLAANNLVGTLVSGNSCQHTATTAVAVFSHYRDVKVALDELNGDGFSHDSLTLIARQAQKCSGYTDLLTSSSFDASKFGVTPAAQTFFSRLFARGKYLLLVQGSKHDVNAASKIVSRRRNHAQVWHFE